MYKNSVLSSHEAYYFSVTKTNFLRLFRKKKKEAVYCENRMKRTNTHCGQNVEFSMLYLLVHIVTTLISFLLIILILLLCVLSRAI
jgi:hypothetical protein